MTLLTKELSGPNGIAFSPDEKYLYVDNWDLKRKVLMRYEVNADGTIANGKVFYDFTTRAGASGARRDQGGPGGPRVRVGSGGRLDPVAGRARRWAGSSLRSTTPTSPLASADGKRCT